MRKFKKTEEGEKDPVEVKDIQDAIEVLIDDEAEQRGKTIPHDNRFDIFLAVEFFFVRIIDIVINVV